MGFQSIFAWEALPEAGFAKTAVTDADRCFHERFAEGWPHRNVRPILPQALESGKSGTSNAPSSKHALASAAPAASSKSPFHSNPHIAQINYHSAQDAVP